MESGFGAVVHILRAKHFSQPECQVIWQHMSHLWPNHHISLHILNRRLAGEKKLPYSWAYYLCNITAAASGSTQITSNALLLLEMVFKETYTSMLNNYRAKAHDLAMKTIIDEALNELKHPNIDIFIELDMHKQFFSANNLTALVEDINEMTEHISARAQQIRLINRREILTCELRKLDEEEAQIEQIINHKNQTAA